MKLETTDKPTIANDPFESWWYYQGLGLFDGKLTKNELRGAFAAGRLGEFEGEATELKKERNTLLARNEALEQALKTASMIAHMYGHNASQSWYKCRNAYCVSDRTLINGEEKS